jgi:phosphomannomutase
LDLIAFRCGFIASCVAAFSRTTTNNSNAAPFNAAGICVTASHNEASDNGLKIVDGHGNVLGEAYEQACEMICNAKTEEQLENALDCFEEKLLFFETSNEDAKKTAVVYFGRDTRESGERLVEIGRESARRKIIRRRGEDLRSRRRHDADVALFRVRARESGGGIL